MQYCCPIEYNISNSYCYKELQLRYLQVEQHGRIWHQEQTDTRQKKTHKVMLCVYYQLPRKYIFINKFCQK